MADVFFDFGATFNGNGTTAAQAASGGAAGAYNTLVGVTATANDKWWLRRSATALNLSTAFTASLANISLIGFPLSGDDYYSTRPASATAAGWDADGGTYAKIQTSGATFNFAPTGSGLNLQRINVYSTLVTNTTTALVVLAGANTTCKHCKFSFDNAVTGSSVHLNALSVTGATPHFDDVIITGSSTGAITTPIVSITQAASSTASIFKNMTINAHCLTLSAASITNTAALVCTGVVGYPPVLFENVIINILGSQTYHVGTAFMTVTSGCMMRDLTINTPSGAANQGASVYLLAPRTEILNLSCVGNAGSIVFTLTNCFVECKRWEMAYQQGSGTTSAVAGVLTTAGSHAPIAFLAAASGCELMLSNADLKSSNAQIFNAGASNKIMLNWALFSGTNSGNNMIGNMVAATNYGWDFELFEQNANRVLGAFKYSNRCGSWLTTNTYRSGSAANFSLKTTITEPTLNQNRRKLVIGQKGREQGFLNLTAGTNVIRLYGAYKAWAGTVEAEPTLRDVGMSFDYYNGTNYTAVSTFADGALTANGSTWINDTGLTGFVITVTLSGVSGDQSVPVNIYASPEFDSSGYIYIDPAITVGTV